MPREMTTTELPTASVPDRLALIGGVVGPTWAKGVLLRRPKVVGMAEGLDLDRRAVETMARLRDRYGKGPVFVPIPGRLHAVVLSPRGAERVLEGTPDPFSPATLEKRRALSHWEPGTSLISSGRERIARRDWSDAALETGCPVHSMAGRLLPVVEEEARGILAGRDRLAWWGFIEGWDAMARRLLFGRGAREDHGLMDLLRTLRKRANWVVAPRREALIRELHRRIAGHLRRAEPGSLAERMAGLPDSPETLPTHQVAQYLFALNTSGMGVWRALALLASHRGALEEAREELREAGGDRRMLPLLRATVYESVRLWPTTPAILRETVREVDWDGATIPARTNLLIYVPFFHRDPGLSYADRYAPELWLDEARGVRNATGGPMLLAPFSAGPGLCPAADLLPMVGSAWLAEAVETRVPRLEDPRRLRAGRRLPGTLDPFSLRLSFR